MADEQPSKNLEAMQTMVELAKERTVMAQKRSEMSADRSEFSMQRTYMNTERTLSVWIRTALSAMIFGIAIDRLGLLLKSVNNAPVDFLFVHATPTTITGAILVLFSMFMAISATLRFIGFVRVYKKNHAFPAHHSPFLPMIYAFITVIFGGILLALLLWIA